MTALEALEGLKTFMEKVAADIKLPKENTNPVEYVTPYVGLITLPHKNFMPVNFQVPYILIGLVNGNDNEHENVLSIRIACATYGGDIKFAETANIPDESGYVDLINLLERIKNKLVNEAVIEKAGALNKPIMYGIYDEQLTYPYWYGYLSFDLQIPVSQRQMIEFL